MGGVWLVTERVTLVLATLLLELWGAVCAVAHKTAAAE
jgi:hypothetical protein